MESTKVDRRRTRTPGGFVLPMMRGLGVVGGGRGGGTAHLGYAVSRYFLFVSHGAADSDPSLVFVSLVCVHVVCEP